MVLEFLKTRLIEIFVKYNVLNISELGKYIVCTFL